MRKVVICVREEDLRKSADLNRSLIENVGELNSLRKGRRSDENPETGNKQGAARRSFLKRESWALGAAAIGAGRVSGQRVTDIAPG